MVEKLKIRILLKKTADTVYIFKTLPDISNQSMSGKWSLSVNAVFFNPPNPSISIGEKWYAKSVSGFSNLAQKKLA